MSNIELANEITEQLRRLTYKSDSSNFEFDVINREHESAVKETILAALNEKVNTQLGELKAKVLVYEEIIKKSNFKPFLLESESNE